MLNRNKTAIVAVCLLALMLFLTWGSKGLSQEEFWNTLKRSAMVFALLLLVKKAEGTSKRGAEKKSFSFSETIGGTYVSGFVTVSIDETQGVFYFSDTDKSLFFPGTVELLPDGGCIMESSNERFPRQIAVNSNGKMQLLMDERSYTLVKMSDTGLPPKVYTSTLL